MKNAIVPVSLSARIAGNSFIMIMAESPLAGIFIARIATMSNSHVARIVAVNC